ncbi:MAG: magnesium transporter [Phycisphaeraceae bacterium]|nr:magnesium transporter [Phycisphaeraceae bacterium]MCW5753500.1 magnesium transporter [Phycisphaeraceae bacterium]
MSLTVDLLQPEVQEAIRAANYRELRETLRALDPADAAEMLESLEPTEAVVAFRVLPREQCGDVFAELSAEYQEELIEHLGTDRMMRVLDAMGVDDRAAVLDELPPEIAQRLLAAMSPDNRIATQRILNYPEGSVGRLMTSDYVSLLPHWTVSRALEHLRKHGRDAETINYLFVIDERGRLIDDVRLRKLLFAEPESLISELCDSHYVCLSATDDQEEAVRAMGRYDRSALPVVDSTGVLLGIVTHDDVADVAEQEATEDIQKLGGVDALDEPYMDTGFLKMLRKRAPSLAVLFCVQAVTVGVLHRFEETLTQAAILAVFIPMIIACGGNSGTQASSLLIRAIALRELSPSDWVRVARRELLTGLCLGSMLGVLATVMVQVLNHIGFARSEHAVQIGFAIGTAIVAIVIWGVLIGALLPLALRAIRLDPAAISSPLVATLMDVSGIFIYFSVATILLRGTVL